MQKDTTVKLFTDKQSVCAVLTAAESRMVMLYPCPVSRQPTGA